MHDGIEEDVPVDVVDFDRAVVQVKDIQPGVLLDELARRVEDVDGIRHIDCHDRHARVGTDVLQFGLDSRWSLTHRCYESPRLTSLTPTMTW